MNMGRLVCIKLLILLRSDRAGTIESYSRGGRTERIPRDRCDVQVVMLEVSKHVALDEDIIDLNTQNSNHVARFSFER
jgi:hypothetical protein